MKRIGSIIMGLAMVASIAHAATNEVTSVNGVGYVKKTLDRGMRYLVTANFNDMTTGTIGDVFDMTQLPSGTIVSFWDPAAQQIGASELLVSFPVAGWSPGTNLVNIGDSFWMVIPGSAPNASYEVTIAGEIPLDATNSIPILPGLNFIGYPYPVDKGISDADLGMTPVSGDILSYWVPGVGWQSELYTTFPTAGWTPGTYQLALGEGFIYKASAVGSWDAPRTFVW
jgi:hypothetical protein